MNTASAEPAKADRARIALAKELERSTAYGVGACCFHPGSAGDGDPGEACDRVGDAIRYALETVPETVAGTRVLIENGRATGIEYRTPRGVETARCRGVNRPFTG